MPVSYLQPPEGFRNEGRTWLDSECVDRGEVFPLGEGVLEWNAKSRGCWYGVDGSELDCWDVVRVGPKRTRFGMSVGRAHAIFGGFSCVIGELSPVISIEAACPLVVGFMR